MAALQPLKFITVAPRAKHTATVIFVHGLGDTGHGWKPVATMFEADPALQHVKWILPHAPIAKVTANMGMQMPTWFDILSFGFDKGEDEAGMLRSSHLLNQLITAEVDAGIPANRIVLGGFSQGGAMSLLTGLTSERRLAGIAVLSGWLVLSAKVKAMLSDHARKLPIFWGHGKADPLVKYVFAEHSLGLLKEEMKINVVDPDEVLGGGIEFHGYEGLAHSTVDDELLHLKAWLKKVLPAQNEEQA